MRVKFHHWFRNKHNWWFAILPEVTIAYAALDGITTTSINIGWFFWGAAISIDRGTEKFLHNNKEE